MLLLVLLTAAVRPHDPEAWFEQDPKPVPLVAESIGNPLDYAGARIGLDVRNVELPRGWEGGYRYCCRVPIIDLVASRPLYLKQWAEDFSNNLVHWQARFGVLAAGCGVRAFSEHHAMVHPGGWSPDAPDTMPLAGTKQELLGRGFRPRFRHEVARLCGALAMAAESTRRACAGLTPDDVAFFARNPGYYLAPDGGTMPELTGDRTQQDSFIARARHVRVDAIVAAAEDVGRAVSRYCAATAGWKKSDLYEDTNQCRDVVIFDAPFGPVVVAGFGNDRHVENAALLIDLGGDDTYLNNAGGCGRSGGVAVCIDHRGDDRYGSADSNYVHGFGFLGTGMLVDLAGKDVYRARHFSQGTGILGVGVLWDKAGSDTFSAHAFCQGAGMFGFGTLLDDSGDDVYDCATMGQGSATTLGMGVLCDLEGDDQYRLACDTTKDELGGIPGCGQGGALSFRSYPWEKKLTPYGGVGLLVDDKGNDSYTSNGWCSQGGSYIMSLGALVDNAGNDHYACGTGQGSGIHVTNAILIDRRGDDVYEGRFRSGGSGGDRSSGFLIDYEGNDTYQSATSSYGTACKPFSFSLFIDYQGDDRYICSRPESTVRFNDWHSFGGVWPESDPNLWPYAVCLDLGGDDDYQVRNRGNNSETHSFGHGIHLDMEWKGGDVIGEVAPLLDLRGLVCRPDASMPDDWLGSCFYYGADPFERFWGIGQVMDSGTALLPRAASLSSGRRSSFSRDGLECIHQWFAQGRIGKAELPEVLRLLHAIEPEVRLVIADDLGLWNVRQAESALVTVAGNDSIGQVRRFALRSLMRLESKKGLELARRLATEDACEDVRRVAASYVGRVRDGVDVFPLLRWSLAEDKASSVKCAAADAMRQLQDARGIEPLREAARTYDVYVQRACGRALAEMGQVEGIQLLIGSLSFPSIDAFYNYDRNVPNYISAYCGLDLPEPDRYVQSKWQEWFDAHRDRIDLVQNVAAFRAFAAVSDSVRDSSGTVQAARYAALQKRFPKNERIRKALAAKLNEVAWGMVTGTKPDVRAGLDYARRAVELVDDPSYWDTLIEAYIANGERAQALAACKAALTRYPDNQMLRERLRHCGELQ